MTVPSLSENINTLEALASSSFSWGLSDGYGSDFILFQTSKVSTYQVMRWLAFELRHRITHTRKGVRVTFVMRAEGKMTTRKT